MNGRRIELSGTVQGVGFRPFVFRLARASGVAGRVRNEAGAVVIEAFGPESVLDGFLGELQRSLPPAARLRSVSWSPIEAPAPDVSGFTIEASEPGGDRRVTVPADLATCDECLAEMRDPRGRRFGHAFISCTACGPRYTILRGLPYDRGATTMAPFPMCDACRREYENPGDRRFHAEPIACLSCGPRVWIVGRHLEDPIGDAARALREGRIVAVKGIGGFQLACDATQPEAVALLRTRKRREEKPFAVMVPDLATAEELARPGPGERELLASVERPIVLCRSAPGSPLAPQVCAGSPLVGVMLAYSPLHHLLLEHAGRPLVMTSGNLTDEPLACSNEEALERLSGIADLFLVHDRAIETPCDDSVARVIAGRPVLLRRARGHVPRGVAVRRRSPAPILGCGAQLKNAVCLLAGDTAIVGPHVGDLDGIEALRHYGRHIELLERLVGVAPQVVAHDLHPDYLSTAYAKARPAQRRFAVQHHHAHVAAVIAERDLDGFVLGLAWDGSGLGTDGTAWGGELLIASRETFRRLATFRPIALAGGDQAVREPWRQALAVLEDAFEGLAPLELFPVLRGIEPQRLEAVRQLVADPSTPRAHGVGRWFDAIGSLVLGRARSVFEGQVPLLLGTQADRGDVAAYPWVIDDGATPWQVDLRPLVRAVAADVIAGVLPGVISSRFHAALVAAGAELVRRATELHGPRPVVLCGGCFQNDVLAEGMMTALSDLRPSLPSEIPPGDGGIALGQAIVADALLAGGG